MALRLLVVYVPQPVGSAIEKQFTNSPILGCWRNDLAGHGVAMHMLVPADQTEPVMDQLEQAFAGEENCRVVLLPVEATIPRPEDDSQQVEGTDSSSLPDDSGDQPVNVGRVSREELYDDIVQSLGVDRVFLAMTLLSSLVAAIGLLRNDVAAIIGAMVIAPLLGPNVAMSFAATLGDFALMRKALITNGAGVAAAFLIPCGLGLVLPVDSSLPAIASRTQLTVGDLALALAAGAAGTLAFTRGLAGPVIGVMVAVALMPPLVTLGMLVGNGQFGPALGALLLVAGNVVSINLAGIATFLAQGIRPRTWWEEQRARKSTRLAMIVWCLLLLLLTAIIYIVNS